MISDNLNYQSGLDYDFTYEQGQPVAISYCAPEKMAEATWNLYLIAVHPSH